MFQVGEHKLSCDKVKAKIFRYDPDSDLYPAYKLYHVQWDEEGNVLQLLKKIYEDYDKTLAFRYYACGFKFCNGCMMMINGKPSHACLTLVKPGDEITVEPMPGYPIIKDLVVDFGQKISTPEGVYEIRKGAIIKKL